MLPTRPATPPPPQPHPSSSDQTPPQSTYSPVLPKSKSRQIAGGLPQGLARPSPNTGSPQLPQSLSSPPPYQSNLLTNAASPQVSLGAERPTATQQSAPPSQRVDPTAYVPSLSASLRSSVCHALGSKHLGRLSAVGQETTRATTSPCVTPILVTVAPTGTWSQNPSLLESSLSPERQANSVHPDDSVSQRGGFTGGLGGGAGAVDPAAAGVPGEYSGSRSGRSPVAMEPFLATTIPSGRFLVFNMLSTWGDPNEVGLRGVQLFDAEGRDLIAGITSGVIANQFVVLQDAVDANAVSSRDVSPRMVDAFEGTEEVLTMMQRRHKLDPNVPEEQQEQPHGRPLHVHADRKDHDADDTSVERLTQQRHNVYNLLKRPYEPTTDESKMYITPFVDGRHHLICIAFQHPVKLSCMRLFNYSGGGRTKTSKGVRLLEALLDDAVIFRGEIEQASVGAPTATGADDTASCETILFTEDRAVLENVVAAQGDQPLYVDNTPSESTARALQLTESSLSSQQTAIPLRQRGGVGMEQVTTSICFAPAGASAALRGGADAAESELVSPPYFRSNNTEQKAAGNRGGGRELDASESHLQPSISTSLGTRAGVIGPCVFPDECPRGVTSVCLQVISTWGDPAYFGLSGLRFRDPHGRPIFNVSFCVVNRPTGKTLSDDDDFELTHLLDGDPNTACSWAFEPSVQLIVGFQHAVDLGFVEIANYSFGTRTHCGIKHARLFACQLPVVSICDGGTRGATSAASATAGGAGSSNGHSGGTSMQSDPNNSAKRSLSLMYARLWDLEADLSPRALPGVLELTPSEGIVLRKAPAMITTLRFQRFDISLSAYESTGGGSSSSSGTLGDRMSSSLRLSMHTRATVAIRRARQSLLEPPEWLLNTQVSVPSILPVGYVFKLSFEFVGNAAAPLKSIMTSAAAHPHETVEFINDEGTVVDAKDLWCEGLVSYTKLLVPSSANPAGSPLSSAPPYDSSASATVQRMDDGGGFSEEDTEELPRVWVTLVFVADAPFAISAVVLRCPRVVGDDREDSEGTGLLAPVAWLEQLVVSADDTPVFESVHVSTPEAYRSSATTLPAVPSVIFFTLDPRILSVYRNLLGR